MRQALILSRALGGASYMHHKALRWSTELWANILAPTSNALLRTQNPVSVSAMMTSVPPLNPSPVPILPTRSYLRGGPKVCCLKHFAKFASSRKKYRDEAGERVHSDPQILQMRGATDVGAGVARSHKPASS